jgi:hypothetical protein
VSRTPDRETAVSAPVQDPFKGGEQLQRAIDLSAFSPACHAEVAGSSPVAPAKKAASNQKLSVSVREGFEFFGLYHCPPCSAMPW